MKGTVHDRVADMHEAALRNLPPGSDATVILAHYVTQLFYEVAKIQRHLDAQAEREHDLRANL